MMWIKFQLVLITDHWSKVNNIQAVTSEHKHKTKIEPENDPAVGHIAPEMYVVDFWK